MKLQDRAAEPKRKSQTSMLSIASLLFGALFLPLIALPWLVQGSALTALTGPWWLAGILLSPILAVILGHVARARARRSAGTVTATGLALAGLTLGYLSLALLAAAQFWLRSRMADGGDPIASSLRVLHTACITYAISYGYYPATLAALGPGMPASAEHADLIDAELAKGTKHGYVFRYVPGPKHSRGDVIAYQIYADPTPANTSAQLHYFTGQDAIIRAENGKPADEHSPPVTWH